MAERAPFENSGPVVRRDLKGKLWRVEETCWIQLPEYFRGWSFRLEPIGPSLHGDPDLPVTHMTQDARLTIEKGYVYDGSSIPLLGRWMDNRVSYWPGALHDVLYEAHRAGKLPLVLRKASDRAYHDALDHFGAWGITGNLCYYGLRLFGGSSAARTRGPQYPVRVRRAA